MDIRQLFKKYKLSQDELDYFISRGIIAGCGEPSEEDVSSLCMIILLKRCGVQDIVDYFTMGSGEGVKLRQAVYLRRLRERILTDVREKNALIDKLDYIIAQMGTERG